MKPTAPPLAIPGGPGSFGLTGPVDTTAPKAPLPPRAHPKMIDAEAAEREAAEAGARAGDAFGKAIVNAPVPPPRPDTFEALKSSAGEAGVAAGDRAGQGIVEGVQKQGPAVEKQGTSILERLQQILSTGAYLPIHLQTDEGVGGGGVGGGLIHRASLGGGGGGGGGGTGGGGQMPAVPASVQMTAGERNELGLIGKYESGGRNVPNYINDSIHTAQGYYQITNSNWRRIAPQLGISARSAMSASLEDQTRVALHLRRQSGLGNWTRYNPRLRGALGRGEQFRPYVPEAPEVPSVPAKREQSAETRIPRIYASLSVAFLARGGRLAFSRAASTGEAGSALGYCRR